MSNAAIDAKRKATTTKKSPVDIILHFRCYNELGYIWSFEIQLQEGSPTFDKVSR